MRLQYWILTLFILCGCKDNQQASQAPQTSSEATTTAEWKGYALGDLESRGQPMRSFLLLDIYDFET